MSDQTRCFMVEITDDEQLKGKWDIVLNTGGYVSISSIGNQDDIEYSGMVHLGGSDFQRLWEIVEKITPEMFYDEVHQLLINSDLDGILEPLILYIKDLLDDKMDFEET
ncbi:MAG: hypothetical protein JW776_05905 [Candidatus Lokiarchaeota archaeon]|nr:hypothetical protein [Candidatus Lokiarchaeota archaeon]